MKFEWKLKDILMVGVTGVLFSFLYLGMVYAGTALCTAMTPFGLGAAGYEPIYGVWFMAGIFAVYVIRKPGVGIVAEMLAALLEVLMGNMFGPRVFVTGFVQGLGTELGFAAFRYKKFNGKAVLVSSAVTVVFSFIWNTYTSAYYKLDLWLVVVMFLIRMVSGMVFGLITKALADGLAKAGVMKGYAIGQQYNDFED
ncbi:MAG: ECF transporter S component [Candidatus Limivivens sp.]|nr:ECF transporter S component [Candidatus Limivivens sp.]